MRKFSLALAIPLLLLAPAVSAQPGKADKPEAGLKAAAMSAEEFLTKTAKANEFEIDASKLAADKAKSKEVKDLAQGLVSDHTAATEKLKAAVQADGKLALPKDDKPDAKHAKTLEKLKDASGEAFDRAYLEAMLTGHKESLERYKGYAASGDNAHLKRFAEEIAPVVAAHLEAVQKLSKSS
jgi:putative membrane protein